MAKAKRDKKIWNVTLDGYRIGSVSATTKSAALRKARYEWGSSSSLSDADLKRFKVNPGNSAKRPKKGKLSKRVPAALSKFFRKVNPALKHATHVRIKKFKDGGFSVRPA